MKQTSKLALVAVVASVLAGPTLAQSKLTGVQDLNDRIDDTIDAAKDDLARQNDAARFGPNNVPQGWRGSLAMSATASDGSSNTGEISLASRLSYGVGSWNHELGVAGNYARANGADTEKEFFGTYEANRYFTDKVYVFGLGRYQYDAFSTEEQDAFIGFGPGFRVLNSDKTTWRVQAGPGVRWTKDALGNDRTETSGIVSSRLWFALTETMSLTNDTDVLFSDHSVVATNDLGLNFKLTDTLSTRFSYRTDYNDQAVDKYENKLGVSLVMGF